VGLVRRVTLDVELVAPEGAVTGEPPEVDVELAGASDKRRALVVVEAVPTGRVVGLVGRVTLDVELVAPEGAVTGEPTEVDVVLVNASDEGGEMVVVEAFPTGRVV